MKWSHVFSVSLIAITFLIGGPRSSSSAQQPKTENPNPTVPPLIMAVRHGDHESMKKLLAEGVDPSTPDPFRGVPAWAWPLLVNDEQGIAIFSKTRRIIPSVMARAGVSTVAVSGNTELAKTLIDKVDSVDGGGLILAAASGDLEMVRLFLENGANPNLVVSHADTPLMAAARSGNAEMIQILIDKHADLEARDPAGRTALHWAVRSGSLDGVSTFLKAGAKVNVTDSAGGTPLALAARRSNMEIMKLLRDQGAQGNPHPGAGAPDSPEAAVRKSLPLLQQGAVSWFENASCISCHHQGLIVSTTALAKKRGFPIDESLALAQIESIAHRDHRFDKLQEALTSVEARLRVDFDGGLGQRAGFFLSALLDSGWKPDNYTNVVSRVVSESQWVDGRWNHGMPRMPLDSSDFVATAYAVRVLPVYAPNDQKNKIAEQVARGKKWLLASKPKTTDDKSFRLFGLHWSGADAVVIKKAADELLGDQRPDGGWAQLPGLSSDAYATGQVLVALHQAGGFAVTEKAYQRGVEYLLRTQEDDGSWLVPSRSIPNNEYFESGFPHGKFQFISFAGSCWATQALLLSAAPRPD